MFNLGFFEILVIVVLALVLIGPEQMPEFAKNIGKLFRDLKRASNEITDSLQREASKFQVEQDSLKKEIREAVQIDLKPEEHSVSRGDRSPSPTKSADEETPLAPKEEESSEKKTSFTQTSEEMPPSPSVVDSENPQSLDPSSESHDSRNNS